MITEVMKETTSPDRNQHLHKDLVRNTRLTRESSRFALPVFLQMLGQVICRECRHVSQSCDIYKAFGRKADPDPGCCHD